MVYFRHLFLHFLLNDGFHLSKDSGEIDVVGIDGISFHVEPIGLEIIQVSGLHRYVFLSEFPVVDTGQVSAICPRSIFEGLPILIGTVATPGERHVRLRVVFASFAQLISE
ncbi:hypothetical protein IX307_001204 [Bacteroides pyogenes]|nr:hypothetical protein [Bacteroides pyogenes]MBR8786890.1 hypothetical protein [Bacteroides pyogenes]MBR8792374.1 hypothetical protein [Bacteroides pyogenes]